MHSVEEGGRLPQHKIGSVLLSMDLITEAQLEEALEIQKMDGRNLGKVLVSLGYLSTDDLGRALSIRLNVEYVALSEVQIDPDVMGIISEDVLLQHKAVPLRVENGRVIVAMSEPNDIFARSDITISAGYPVTPVIAAEDAVRRLQEQLLGGEDSVQSAVDQLNDAVDAARAADAAAFEAEPQENGAVAWPVDNLADTTATRKAERVEPGAQPEVDFGEPVAEPAVASETTEREESQVRPVRAKGRKGGGKIGEILIPEGKITEEHLGQALSMQRNDPRDVGKILLSLG